MREIVRGIREQAPDIKSLSLSRLLLYDSTFLNKLQSGEMDESDYVSCNACYSAG